MVEQHIHNPTNELEQNAEQLKIKRLYTERLNERNILNGKDLELATNRLLNQYLKNNIIR